MAGRRTSGLISVGVRQLCLLVTTQLICRAVNSNEVTVTHPSTHPAQRDTTSTLHLDEAWRDATTADDRFTQNNNNDNVLNLTRSNFPEINETSAINESDPVKKLLNINADSGLVSMATAGQDVTSSVGRPVPHHVTYILTYVSPKNATDDGETRSTEVSGEGSQNLLLRPSVAMTTSRGVPSNSITSQPAVADSTWESWTTHDARLGAVQQTTHDGTTGSLDQLMTSANVTLRHQERDLIDRDEADDGRSFMADINIIALKDERTVVVVSCVCGMLTSLLFVIIVFCLRDCSMRRVCQCLISTSTHCCCCCCKNDVSKCDGESLLLHGNPVNCDVTLMT